MQRVSIFTVFGHAYGKTAEWKRNQVERQGPAYLADIFVNEWVRALCVQESEQCCLSCRSEYLFTVLSASFLAENRRFLAAAGHYKA